MIRFSLLFSLVMGGGALADPCTAIPDKGPKPSWVREGAAFAGQVRYVGDGDSICVSQSPDPKTWVEVRLADWFAPELHEPGGEHAKATMSRLTAGAQVVCTVTKGNGKRIFSYDRVIASCTLGNRSLGDLMRAQGIAEGGRGHGP